MRSKHRGVCELRFIHSVRPAMELSDPLRRSNAPILAVGFLVAAMALLDLPHEEKNGRAFIDAEVLRLAGVTDLSRYGGHEVDKDIFVD